MQDYYSRLASINQGSRFARGMGEGPIPQQQETNRSQVFESPIATPQTSPMEILQQQQPQQNPFQDIQAQRSQLLQSLQQPQQPFPMPNSQMQGPLREYSQQSQIKGVQAPKEYQGIISSVAKEHGVKADLVNAIIKQESNFNPNAKSHAGAQGLMQLMPNTAKGLGVKNSLDPRQNVDGGTRYIKQLLGQYDDVRLSLAAYNWGMGNVNKAIKKYGNSYEAIEKHMPKETRNYVPKVLGNMGL